MRSLLMIAALLLASCGGGMPHLTPYKMDIRQGNYITPEMREKLKIGMSRQQVRYVLGTPLLGDVQRGERWDYLYTLAQRGELVERQQLTLYFEADNLVRIQEGAPLAPAAK